MIENFPYSHFSSSFYIMEENFYRIISTTLHTKNSMVETFIIILLTAKICTYIFVRKESKSFLFSYFFRKLSLHQLAQLNAN